MSILIVRSYNTILVHKDVASSNQPRNRAIHLSDEKCICIFSAHYPPSLGGIEVFTENLACTLAKMGHKVIVVTSNIHGLADTEVVNGVEIVRLPCKPLMKGRLPIPDKNAAHKSLMAKLESQPIDSILINTRFFPHSFVGAELSRKKGIRPIVLDHGSDYITLDNPLLDIAIKAYEHAVTHRMKGYNPDFYGISNASVRWLSNFGIDAKGTISNAMDSDTFVSNASDRDFRAELGLSPQAFIVAFTGRLIPEKGVKSLLDAAKLIPSELDVHIVLAGDGPMMQDVKLAEGNVHPLGRIDRCDMAALLLKSDAFCLPTRSEGFSTSLLEAAACGCAPIITNVGGVEELIPDDSYGIMLDDASPESAAEAISFLAAHPDVARSIGAKAAMRAKEFDWDRTARMLLDAFEDARHSPSASRN